MLNNSTHNSSNQNKASLRPLPGNPPMNSMYEQLDEGLKLPKVIISTNDNIGNITSKTSNTNNVPARGGSRQSKR